MCAYSYLLDTLIFILNFLNADFTLKNFEIIIDKNNDTTEQAVTKNKNHLNEMKNSYNFILNIYQKIC